MQASADKNVQELLEHFLSWLLDARWFPETDVDEKARLKGKLRKVQRIVKRMEAFAGGIPDIRLQQGLAGWQSYENDLAALAKQQLRTAPHLSGGGSKKGSPEIAQRLMSAVLIIRKLRPKVSAYEEVQRLLADPSQLPYPIRASEETIQEMRAGTLRGGVTAAELFYFQKGRDMPMRRYVRTVKALQSSVARLEKEFKVDKRSAQFGILEQLYAEYLWSQKGQAGFSDDETAMLNSLVRTQVDGGAGGSAVPGQ